MSLLKDADLSRLTALAFFAAIAPVANAAGQVATNVAAGVGAAETGVAGAWVWATSSSVVPTGNVILPNGTNVTCRVIDVSASGAAIAINPDLRPAVGSAVTIGKTTGRVVRHIEDGFAIEFNRLQHPDSIEDNVTGE